MRAHTVGVRDRREWIREIGWIAALALAGAASPAAGQQLEREARRADGPVLLAYPAADNVCGAGDGILIREPDGSNMFVTGRFTVTEWRSWREGEAPCETGDVMLRMTRKTDGWGDVQLAVGSLRGEELGGIGLGGTDLGYVDGQGAADFLLAMARDADRRGGRDLIMAAAIAADAEIWPELLDMARDRALRARTRKAALHWLGRRAAREAVDGLGGIVRDKSEDDEIREAAVFAISQLPDDQAISMLIEIVHTMDDARVINRALFWLAEFDDPRAVAVFEDILRGPAR